MKGSLFVFEGPDGVGKTSIIDKLLIDLLKMRLKVIKCGFPGYDKGTIGDLVHRLHNRLSSFDIKEIEPASLQLLHVAAHIDSINRTIIPAIKSGKIVLLDRYWWSVLVYGTVSGIENPILEMMIRIEKSYWKNIFPDTLFLLTRNTTPLKENINIQTWKVIKNEYVNLSNREKSKFPIIIINNEKSLESTTSQIMGHILQLL